MRARLPSRRLTALLVVLGLIATPAVLLRTFCVGKSCDDGSAAEAAVPFCPLPADLRALVATGFRSGRSPDVMGAGGSAVATSLDGAPVPWPSTGGIPATRVPIAFLGSGISSITLPRGTGLDQIAPTLAGTLGLSRNHPEVRAGAAVPGVAPNMKAPAPLAVEIVWKGVGTAEIGGAWPQRTASLIRAGAATLDGTTGSLPLDPAATLTTIGTGGLPSQHGITGTLLRGGDGTIATAWSSDAPDSVISTLPDDLVRADGDARVAMVASSRTDRGLIGNGWYLGADPHQLVMAPHDPLAAVRRLLAAGLGKDPVPDVLGVVVRASIPRMDRETEAIVRAVMARVPTAVLAITATGSFATSRTAIAATAVARQVDGAVGQPVVADPAAGGFFLDQTVLADSGLSADAAVQAMRGLTTPQGSPLFADAFPSFSVAFSRYC